MARGPYDLLYELLSRLIFRVRLAGEEKLHGPAMRKVDRSDASFWAAVNNPEFSPDLFTRMDRQRVKVWLQAAFDQFARLGDLV